MPIYRQTTEGLVHTKKKINIPPGRLISLGFLTLILAGTALLSLPISAEDGKSIPFIDALFTATSAVCVTGLVVFDPGATLSVFGEAVTAALIQLGGLGITTFGLGIILLMRKKAGIREMVLAKESFNQSTLKGAMGLIKTVILTSFAFEAVGALLCMPVFLQRYSFAESLRYSLFHTIAAFNNAGFDIFGTGDNMYAFSDHAYLNIVTMLLVIFGGLGFFVMSDIITKKKARKLSLHTKVVLTMTAVLIVGGALLLKLSEGAGISWLEAFFTSVSTRTAGFATKQMATFSTAGIMIMNVLMVIGASPGSCGGGIKTTTAFVLVKHLFAYSTNSETVAFKRKIPDEAIKKALSILMLAVSVILVVTTAICALEPHIPLSDITLEVCSAFGTVGLSTGITATLSHLSKFIIVCTMFVGRLGPLTIATLWINNKDTGISRAEETLQIG